MRNTDTTLDRLRQAKDALIYAMRAAESEVSPAHLKKLDVITGKVESLEHEIAAWSKSP